MNIALIFYVLMLMLPLLLLVFRVKRMLAFHQVWIENPTEIEGRAARTNFIIHLVFCAILFFITLGSLMAFLFYLTAGRFAV